MRVKISFFICLSICFIGSIFCGDLFPSNSSPNVPRKQYNLSDPAEKVDLVEASAKCLASQMTLATIDDRQDQQILLDQLRKDFSLYENLESSEFWLVDPNGFNNAKSTNSSSMALPHNSGQKCAKLVFTTFYLKWVDGNCHEKYRFICREKPYPLRSGDELSTLTRLAYTCVVILKNMLKPNLLRAKAYTEAEIDKMMDIVDEDLRDLTNGADFIPILPLICQPFTYITDKFPSIKFCNTGKIVKGAAMIIGSFIGFGAEFFQSSNLGFLMKLFRAFKFETVFSGGEVLYKLNSVSLINPDTIKSNMESIIPKIQNGLHWSPEKAKEAADAITKALIEELSYVPKYFLMLLKNIEEKLKYLNMKRLKSIYID